MRIGNKGTQLSFPNSIAIYIRKHKKKLKEAVRILGDLAEYSLEGLILKLKFQYFGHWMQRTDSLEETLMLEKIEGGRRKG